jgi:hypothetical protein
MKLYTVYCSTCSVSKKYYIGVHKTGNPNDNYIGSGKYLKHAIAKYGEAAFTKKIIATYDNAEQAFAKEELLVRIHRRNKLCMNINQGGYGGWEYVNRFVEETEERKLTRSAQGKRSSAKWLSRITREELLMHMCYMSKRRGNMHLHTPQKLSKALAENIFAFKGILRQADVAAKFNVSQPTVSMIFNKKIWNFPGGRTAPQAAL